MNVVIVRLGTASGAPSGDLSMYLGAERSELLRPAMLADTVRWAAESADRVLVAFSGRPPTDLPGLAHPIQLGGGSSGEVIADAVDRALSGHAHRVLLVGSHAPTLPERHVSECFERLDYASSILIPSEGGGWLGMAVRAPLGRSLEGVRWRRSLALRDTRAALTSVGGSPPVLLPPWYEVVDAASVDRLRADLRAAGGRRAPRTAALLELID